MPRRQWRRTVKHLRSKQAWRIRSLLWGGAVLVGLVATGLAWGSDFASLVFAWAIEDRPWLPFLLTPLGLVLIAWLTRRFFPAAEGSGIPQAIAMLQVRDHKIRQRVLGVGVGLFKGAMIILGLACGASIGREGPTVHIAAAISYSLARVGRFPHYVQSRGLILAGAAAGLSAAFNTPLAGIVFAIEELSRKFEGHVNGVVFIAVIVAGMTALSLQGNYSYFNVEATKLDTLHGLAAVLICGFVGGLLGGLFSSLLIHGGAYFNPLRMAHPYLFAAACGLLLALIGMMSGGTTYGTGYDEANPALMFGEGTGLFYPFLKFAATVVSYLSGIPGGIFSPSLAIGANLGAELAPLLPAAPGTAIALLGMVAYFSGVVQAPLTAVVIVMEMTNEPSMLLPLLATSLLAQWVSRHVCPRSLYRALAINFLHQPEPHR
jgi:H+/Cl- antiporter ClcA